jgi:heterodisulfide reductase subunit A2
MTMADNVRKDIFIYLCRNCIPGVEKLPRQWTQDGVHVQMQELPCTGKITTQYMFHTLEGGSRGVCVITCPMGECTLTQGNYRAAIRMKNVKQLLAEIGLEPERAEIIHFSPGDSLDKLNESIHSVVRNFISLGQSPVLEKEQAGL